METGDPAPISIQKLQLKDHCVEENRVPAAVSETGDPILALVPYQPQLQGTDHSYSDGDSTFFFDQELAAVSGDGLIVKAKPISYICQAAPTSLNSALNNGPTTHQVNDIQPMHSDVCDMTCNDKDLDEKHVLKNNLHDYVRPSDNSLSGSMPGTMDAMEMKIRKVLSSGASTESVKVCTVCNVVCYNQDFLRFHLSGKKHARQVKLANDPAAAATNPITGPPQNPAPSMPKAEHPPAYLERKKRIIMESGGAADAIRVCTMCDVVCNTAVSFLSHVAGHKHSSMLKRAEAGAAGDGIAKKHSEEHLERKKRNSMESGTAGDAIRVCTMCDVVCNTAVTFNSHVAGHKHLAMLKMAEAGAAGNGIAKKHSEEDLERKKRKVIENGTAADAVQVCAICNVVCTYPAAITSHISGYKHLQKVKEAEARAAVSGA